MHLIGKNTAEGPVVLCATPTPSGSEHYWRSLEVSHALGHQDALQYRSQAGAWKAAEDYGYVDAIAIDSAEYPKPATMGVKA